MEWHIPRKERTYLRELARKQAEYAALPVMAERRRMWLDLNDGRPAARPPVVVETWTFDRDFMPASVFRCSSATGRAIEGPLLRNVRNHELLDDDKVIPSLFEMGWFTDIDHLGVKIESEAVKDAQGIATAYRFLHPARDAKEALAILRPAVCRVDRERTMAWKAFLEELFDGLLQVQLSTGLFGATSLTQQVIRLMGMEAFFIAMYDHPDDLHQLMGFLRDNALRVMRWAETEGLLRLPNYLTTRLPAPGYRGPTARLCDMWGSSESQETVGISPAMFHEFCFPYYRAICEPMGLLYFGCCEPAHPFWNDIRRLPHLKNISISRWCDQRFMGDALRGTDIVFSRKPDPKYFGVDVKLDEAAWVAHVRETLEATRGVFVEFIMRDVYTVHGNLNKPRRAVELARDAITRYCRA